jgi:phenylalanyl-tRNA synthetase beta chain
MRYHSSLTKQYISINDTPDAIAQNLTLKTCEVEEVIHIQIPRDVVIGKVTAIHKHPQADKLIVCQVDCGDKGKFQICTGGENVVADSYVPVAIPWCYLPIIDLSIEPRKLRGEDSNGMICSKGELGINEDEEHHWIWILQYGDSVSAWQRAQTADFDDITDADCGRAIADKYPWLERYIFDIDNKTVTHRPDLTGHFGIARELNAIYGHHNPAAIAWNALPQLMQQHTHTSIDHMVAHGTHHSLPISVWCESVQVYSSLLIEGCSVHPSTLFTRMMLLDCGMTPRNNWVDFSQYVMLLTGQPIHCFDADTIVGGITVRYAHHGELFVDLMQKEHTLIDTDIVIADNEKILALGGVVGGFASMVTEKTSRILIEIAHFDAVIVRKTGTRLSLRTDAELRFEKNINPVYTAHTVQMVLDALQYMRKDLGMFTMAWLSFITQYHYTDTPLSCVVDFTQISRTIMWDETLSQEVSRKILTNLWCSVYENTVTMPWWRSPSDLAWQHDIVEEIVRLYGYEHISPQTYTSQTSVPQIDPHVLATRKLEDHFISVCGYDQCETYPWIHEKYIVPFGIDTSTLYQIQNPLAPEHQYLRPSMVTSLWDIVQKNYRLFPWLSLMDIGKIRPGCQEKHVLSIMQYQENVAGWKDDPWITTIHNLKEGIRRLWVDCPVTIEKTTHAHFHTHKQGVLMVGDSVVGEIWQLHPRITDAGKISEHAMVICGMIDVGAALWCSVTAPLVPITQQEHIVRKDVCFVLSIDSSRDPLMKSIRAVDSISEITIQDMYIWESLDKDKKSITLWYSMIFSQAPTSDVITQIMQRVIDAWLSTWAMLR